MGREVRRVPFDWEHPRDKYGKYIPLYDGADYDEAVADWNNHCSHWFAGNPTATKQGYINCYGPEPSQDEYMPLWPNSKRTHYQMYETCTKGTPISPVMGNPKELARWLTHNDASTFGDHRGTFEQWLAVCKGAYAPSAVATKHGLESGVSFVGDRYHASQIDTPSDLLRRAVHAVEGLVAMGHVEWEDWLTEAHKALDGATGEETPDA